MSDENKTTIRPDTSKYQAGRSSTGSKTMNNGDEVAQALDGLTLDEVKEVAEAMGVENVDKYDHLNIGQRRMSLGNRIRGRQKACTTELAALEKAAAEDGAPKSAQVAVDRFKDFSTRLEAACKGPHKARNARIADAEKAKAAKAKAA